MTKKRLILLDTHAILHRAYHALPDFSSSKGEATGALYGLITMLVKIATDLRPDYILAAYDLPKGTFRHAAFDGYKAKRPKTEEALAAQIERSRDVLVAFNVPIYEKEGYEADDILGTAVEQMKGLKDLDIIIASGDMDTLQLVDDSRVRVYTLKKGISDTILYDEKAVRDRFGFGPELIPDYKGLRGDPSDNIPGVRGVGEKSAGALIQAYGSLDAIYNAIKKDPESVAEKAGVTPRIVSLLVDQEEEALFSKTLAEIRRDTPVTISLPEKSWREGISAEHLLELLHELEFRSLIPRVKSLVGAELFAEQEEEVKQEEAAVPEMELLEAQIALFLIDSNITDPDLEGIYRFAKTRDFAKAKEILEKEIEKRNLAFVYREIELPLRPILREMERRGVLVDVAFLQKLSAAYTARLDTLVARIYKHAGEEFNINSPKQLSVILFDKLGLSLKNHKKTGGGQKSTRESELEKLRDQHPIVDDILAHRELQKLLSTYIDSIPTLVDSNHRLHTTYVQWGAATGRLSSQNPNLQNIPIKTELGRPVREAFIAQEGYSLVAFDYSQIELRIAAFLSGDEKLSRIFREGGDIHASVAAEVFGVVPEEVTSEMRRKAKVINFGILYGMGVNALQQNLGASRKEAQEFLNRYFETFSRLAEYLEETKAFASKHGYVATYFGRRRTLEGIRSSIPFIRASAERMAINAPMQGTQADIVKLAMIRVNELLAGEGLLEDVRLLLQVHDELVYEVKTELLGTIAPKVKHLMESILPKEKTNGVPIIAKGSAGPNWGTLKPL